ncbi:MAG: peptidyl-arginine deiminase [Bacteroidetes bacterium]|nr:MAG: peptidyl-arginine deiminase [Bacteroidota bacterium]
MKRIIRLVLSVALLITTSYNLSAQPQTSIQKSNREFVETDPPTGPIRSIAEFEPMESVIIAYPLGIPTHLVATLSEEILVNVLVSGSGQENSANNQFANAGVNMDNIKYIYTQTDSYWTRDYSPWFIEYGETPTIGIIDFPYNRPRPHDDDVPIVMADSLNVELFGMNVIQTGGNYMSDGINVGAATDLVLEENNLTSAQIDQKMKDYLGLNVYHKNNDPLDDYIKHIDCWGKFLAVDKVLIGQVPESDYRYQDFEDVANYYAEATSGWGTPYQVYRVYTPGTYPNTPYTNSLILNNRVFVPQTGSQWDDEALAVYQEAMPGYEIIGVMQGPNAWLNTDALHCRTHEVADRKMLRIKHTPILGEVENEENYSIVADIYPLSGQQLYADSVKVYYKYGKNQPYQSIIMNNIDNGRIYTAEIPAPQSTDTVLYYIHAADMSGRSENHPYIGGADPHDFYVNNTPQVANISVDDSLIEVALSELSSSTHTLTISNTGNADLTYEINFTYTDGADWISTTNPTGTIMPGQEEDIILTFDSSDLTLGTYQATMNIVSNDPDQSTISVPIELSVIIDIETPDDMIQDCYVAPNPFNHQLSVGFTLLHRNDVTFSIENMFGGTLCRYTENYSSGKHLVDINQLTDVQKLSNGMYFIKLKIGNHIIVKKIIKQ